MSRLHQRARRRVEIGVAGGSGDRKRSDRPRGADGEGDADDALRAPGAGGGRVEHAAADGGAHLADIGRKRRGARRRARWRARRRSAARWPSGERRTETAPQPVWARGSAWALLLPGPSALRLARADEALAEGVRPPSEAGVRSSTGAGGGGGSGGGKWRLLLGRLLRDRRRWFRWRKRRLLDDRRRRRFWRTEAAEVARRPAAAAARRRARGQLRPEPARRPGRRAAARLSRWIVRPASTLRPAAPEFPRAGLPAEYRRSLRPAVRASSAPERRSRARRCGARRR